MDRISGLQCIHIGSQVATLPKIITIIIPPPKPLSRSVSSASPPPHSIVHSMLHMQLSVLQRKVSNLWSKGCVKLSPMIEEHRRRVHATYGISILVATVCVCSSILPSALPLPPSHLSFRSNGQFCSLR